MQEVPHGKRMDKGVLAAQLPFASSLLVFDSHGHHSPAAELPFVYVDQPLVFAPSGTNPLLVKIINSLRSYTGQTSSSLWT